MIVLIPINRYKVTYSVAEGLPFSALDRLILNAVASGATNQENLVKMFELHPRLIIQSLISLTEAGWIALGSTEDHEFVITPAGRHSLQSQEPQLPPTLTIKPRTSFVVVERTTGAVILENHIQYVPRHRLEAEGIWDANLCLDTHVYDNRLDESEVYYILPHDQDQRIHWVGPIELTSKNHLYMVVNVDLESELILNLPDRLSMYLRPEILHKAYEIAESKQIKTLNTSSVSHLVRGDLSDKDAEVYETEQLINLSVSQSQILFTQDQFEDRLRSAFDRAKSVVFVSSPYVDSQRLLDFEKRIREALTRGVDVHIFLGMSDTAAYKQSLNWLKKIQYDMRDESGQFSFNRSAGETNVSLLCWDEYSDETDNLFIGIMGNYNWLSASEKRISTYGIQIENPRLVADISRFIVDLWQTIQSERMSKVPDFWRRVANKLDEMPESEAISVTTHYQASAKILVNNQHNFTLHEILAMQENTYIGVSYVNDGFAGSLLEAIKAYPTKDIYLFVPEEQKLMDIWHDYFNISGFRTPFSFVANSQAFCITSFEWGNKSMPSRNIGFFIQCQEMAADFLRYITNAG